MKVFVTAKPNAKEEFIEQVDRHATSMEGVGGHFIVAVKEPPVAGRANAAIARALARHFGVAPSRVRLVSGFSAKQKVFEVS
mgnify:CR=1 FL=1